MKNSGQTIDTLIVMEPRSL